MSSSTTTIPSASPLFLLRRPTHDVPFFTSLKPTHSNLLRLSASLSHLSWFSPPPPPYDTNDYNGWAMVNSPPHTATNKGLSKVVIGGVFGSSLALLLAAISYVSLSRKGFKFQIASPLNALHDVLNRNQTKAGQRITVEFDERDGDTVASPERVSNDTREAVASGSLEKLERVIVSVAIDSTQQEAVSVLKKLKILEDDVIADELCTRREYARWLVHTNSLLERNPKHRIVPSVLLSGTVIAAFDDVDSEDPDFESIQALAEAGIIPSKLSGKNSGFNGSKGQGGIYFLPDRFISRLDLINWKAQVEYELKPDNLEQISRMKVGYMDVKEMSWNASPELFMDMLAGDKSIVRRVFGQSKRFQPNKPSTKAQAAVALTSGRMTEAIAIELSRLKAERSSKQAEMEEIKSELLSRGDIKRSWDEKLNEERIHGFEVEKLYAAACHDLEQEFNVQEKNCAGNLKEKAAMDCQRQLLLNLKLEVNEMSEKLESERAIYMTEKSKLQDTLCDLQTRQEELLDAKSILEAEKEAIRIMRSWVEDEARRSQARAKVLEEVGRRWRWDDRT